MNIFERATRLLKNLIDPPSNDVDSEEDITIAEDLQTPEETEATNKTAETADTIASSPKEQEDKPQLATSAERRSQSDTLQSDDERFRQELNEVILRFIPNAEINVEDIAREMAMSHTIFYERVRRVIGITPSNLIKKARMEQAKELLASGHYTVADVSDRVGFSNWRYFSTVYKNYWGVSPSKAKGNP